MQIEDNKELKLLRSKVKYLEDRITTVGEIIYLVINNILGRFQMTENNDTAQGFKDIESNDNGNELI